MDRQTARLVKLCLSHGDRRAMQIDITDLQLQGLRESEPGGGDQPEQCSVYQGTQATRGRQAVGMVQQLEDLLVSVDVWRQSALAAAKGSCWWHLAGHFELAVVSRKRPQYLEPAGGSYH